MRSNEAYTVSNASADGATTWLKGGIYAVDCVATFGGGNVHLQILAGDGSTWQDVGSSTNFTTAGFVTQIYLPPGQYRWHITTSTAVYARAMRIPEE